VKNKLSNIKNVAVTVVKKARPSNDVALKGTESKVPVITNSTVSEHRDQVLADARKLIIPLHHSRRRIVVVSSTIFIAVIFMFTVVTATLLYKFKQSSTFLYRVTQVVPYPIARIGTKFVSYESYLFELRHFVHYSETQQKTNFDSEEGKLLLADFKKRAQAKVIDDTYIKILAEKNNVSVSAKEIDDAIQRLRDQNLVGGTKDQVFEDVLKEFWGWSVSDLRRSVKQGLLKRKVAAVVDVSAKQKADTALNELRSGIDFSSVAKKYSDDLATRDLGGEVAELLEKTDNDIDPNLLQSVFSINPGQTTGILNTGFTLEIIKLVSLDGDKAKIARIQINLKDIGELITQEKQSQPFKQYVTF
jgi:hypothetical protein